MKSLQYDMPAPSEQSTRDLLHAWQDKKIAVIGDIMLDRYFWGHVSRISPEAPVPVVDIDDETFHLGGASNVASNLKSLGAEPILLGAIGEDNSGKITVEIAKDAGLETLGILAEAHRPTTVKTRIIGNNQQIARLDRETKSPISTETESKILDTLRNFGAELSGIILEDYNKGVITPTLIAQAIDFARQFNIPVFVDPKFSHFFAYRGVTLFKPNKKETQDALGKQLKTDEDIYNAGRELLARLDCDNVLITLGARGMMLFEKNGSISSVETKARHIADVSGAGDTVIATIAAAVAGGARIGEAAALANIAAGVVCQEPGIISIKPDALLSALHISKKLG